MSVFWDARLVCLFFSFVSFDPTFASYKHRHPSDSGRADSTSKSFLPARPDESVPSSLAVDLHSVGRGLNTSLLWEHDKLEEDSPNERNVQQIGRLPGLWHRVLFDGAAGRVSRDRIMEGLVAIAFNDTIKTRLQEQAPILGGMLDPLWLWPIECEIKKNVYKANVKACNLYMHNLKSAELLDVIVMRDAKLEFHAIRLLFRVPIVWMSGFFKLYRALFLGFIPAGGQGHFNIDFKDVTVGLITTLRVRPETEDVDLDVFEVGINWDRTAVKFDSILGGIGNIADFSLNQMGVADEIIKNQRRKIIQELEDYTRALYECILFRPSDGLELCMRQWWVQRGWEWPWEYPTCP